MMLSVLTHALFRRLLRSTALFVFAGACALSGCATRPISGRIAHFDAVTSYGYERASDNPEDRQNLVLLAFSGGGTRAAAFSFGVLETLRAMQVTTRSGRKLRALDEVDVITGISGGSFTALAYGLYGDRLFDEYERRFLKRNVQGELIARAFNPFNWGALVSTGWGRSELAANLYDEILFDKATYADLRPEGPRIFVGATDLAEGTRIIFNQQNFDVMCADLRGFRLSRAAAASSAVPVLLSSVTIDNYGGTCDYRFPTWTKLFLDNPDPPRPAARTLRRLQELENYADRTKRPYLHLVDGGVSDNIGVRGLLDVLATFEALHAAGIATPFDNVRNIIVFVVNSLATPPNDWDLYENPPGTLDVLIKATGTPIDRYSYDTVETLKDMQAQWQALRQIREALKPLARPDPKLDFVMRAPDANIYVIDVSFSVLADAAERDYLNRLPTSFALPDEAVDRLRAAARTAILESPDIKRFMQLGVLRMTSH